MRSVGSCVFACGTLLISTFFSFSGDGHVLFRTVLECALPSLGRLAGRGLRDLRLDTVATDIFEEDDIVGEASFEVSMIFQDSLLHVSPLSPPFLRNKSEIFFQRYVSRTFQLEDKKNLGCVACVSQLPPIAVCKLRF